jgi:hypothetical protein
MRTKNVAIFGPTGLQLARFNAFGFTGGLTMKATSVSAGVSIVVALLLLPIVAHGEGVREQRPNIVGGELVGRAPILTVNYERYFNNKFGIGVGVLGAANDNGFFGFLPLYVSINPVGDTKSLYLSLGVNIIGGGENLEDTESTSLIIFGAGFQYQSPGGFMVRPGLYGLVPSSESDDFLVLPGVSLGGSF